MSARTALGAQVADHDSGGRVSDPELEADRRSLETVVDILLACRPSPGRPVGTPAGVIAAVRGLVGRAQALQAAGDRNGLRASLRSLEEGLDAVLRTDFPVVFGMPYGALVDRVLAERSAVALADRAAARGELVGAAAALGQASRAQRKIGAALRKQARRAGKAEKAA